MTRAMSRLDVRRSCLRFHGGGEAAHQRALARALESAGIATRVTTLLPDALAREVDVAHVWYAQDPRQAQAAVAWTREHGLPCALTPLCADPRAVRRGFLQTRAVLHARPGELDQALRQFASGEALRRELEVFGDEFPGDGIFARWEASRGDTLRSADVVLCLSAREAERVHAAAGVPRERLAITPVGCTALPRTTADAGDYVLVPAARLDPFKNQLAAILAQQLLGPPLVTTGSAEHREYAALCRRVAGTQVKFTGLVSPPRLGELIAGARVILHPSHVECASLAVLESAAAGSANVVTSDCGSEREYLGDGARYVDPCSVLDVAETVRAAWDAWHGETGPRDELAERARAFSWPRAAAATADALHTIATPACAPAR